MTLQEAHALNNFDRFLRNYRDCIAQKSDILAPKLMIVACDMLEEHPSTDTDFWNLDIDPINRLRFYIKKNIARYDDTGVKNGYNISR